MVRGRQVAVSALEDMRNRTLGESAPVRAREHEHTHGRVWARY